MQIIDTHSHIHWNGYKLSGLEELKKARANGVSNLIVIGEAIDDCKAAIKFAQDNSVYATVGVHPHTAKNNRKDLKAIEKLVEEKQTNRIVAVGECGLDYYYLHSPKEDQRAVFIDQIEMALRHSLPLSFHIRGSKEKPDDAFDEFFEIVDRYKGLRGVLHCFSGPLGLAKKAIKRGFYVSLNGIVTFSKDGHIEDLIEGLDYEKVMVETDAPFLTPEPYRGKINTPQYVVEVVKFIADKRNVSVDEVAEQTTSNARELFGI